MKNNTQEHHAIAVAQLTTRVDMYTGIHKALRALMADTLVAVGRMDPSDTADLASVTGRVLELLDFCALHITHENSFVHAAVEARAPGGSEVIAHEHHDHLQHITKIKSAVAALWSSPDTRGAAPAVLALYRDLALFVAENFQHMHVEETVLNAVLWARYTDAELVEIHNNLVASILPADMMFILRWMVPYMNPAERVSMLSDMQAHAPAHAFSAALEVVQPHLTVPEWAKLTRSLGLPPVRGLVEA
jgi:hypothetical protein